MPETYADFEPTDLPLFNWGEVDHEAIKTGFDFFYTNNQITGFKMDASGNYVRDEDGKLIAYRTSKQRHQPKSWFNNYNQ
jgi:hypothetical protein